jgi:hypothetical protein
MKNKNYTNFKNLDVISASEIGQFCFCSISWYLQKCGYKPHSPKLDIGIKKHENLGRIIELSEDRTKKSKFFAIIGYSIFTIGIIIYIFEVVL